MKKITDAFNLGDLGNTQLRGKKTIEAAMIIGGKRELNDDEVNILIEADNFRKSGVFKQANIIIDERVNEIFSVMGFVAEHSVKWKGIMEDENAKIEFIKVYAKGVAGLVQRDWFGKEK